MSTAISPVRQLGSGFEAYRATLKTILPKHLDVDRIIKTAMSAFSRSPNLQRCTVQSMIKATIVAAELGLTPGSLLGEAYFVPFGNEVQLIPGYKGLIKLARQSGEVLSISAYVVDESDFFEVELGLEPRVIHRPNLQGRVNRLKAVYAVAKLADGGHAFEFMLPHDIDAIRVRSKGASSGPWKTDYYEMAKKTVLKRLLKLLALSTDKGDALALAVQADYSAETGEIFKTSVVEELNEVLDDIEPVLPESPKVSMLAGAIIEAKGSK